MCGYGRIIEYTYTVNTENFAEPLSEFIPTEEKNLLSVKEGKFKYGKLDSYGRVQSIEGWGNDNSAVVKVGYFTAG